MRQIAVGHTPAVAHTQRLDLGGIENHIECGIVEPDEVFADAVIGPVPGLEPFGTALVPGPSEACPVLTLNMVA